MKSTLTILFFVLSVNIAFCQEATSQLELLPEYPLKTILYYCQHQPDAVIAKVDFTYNEKHKIIKSVTVAFDSSYRVIKEFKYDSAGRLISIIPSSGSKKIFNYNEKSELIYEGYENSQRNPVQKNLYNEKGRLISRTISGDDWSVEYNYEYDASGKLNKRLKNKKAEISYEYSNGRLCKETTYEIERKTETFYEYDDSGQLIRKTENGKTIEYNVYEQKRLIEKRTSYFGIDPCFSIPCCMQEIEKYEYFK